MSYIPAKIIFVTTATKDTGERNFPVSRHRSKRVHKKLLKRYNGYLYRQDPAIHRIGNIFFAHPAFKPEIEAHFRRAMDISGVSAKDYFMRGLFG